MLTCAYSYDLTVNFIRESVCACAKLIVDEEAHGTLNRIVEMNKTLTKMTQKE
jgi:hypothetical protein